MSKEHNEIEFYGDTSIASADAPVPTWLKVIYFTLPIWGIITWQIYWNGSHGWLDPSVWGELQKAANTRFPFINEDEVQKEK